MADKTKYYFGIKSTMLAPIFGAEWNQGTDTWRHIDKNGNTIHLNVKDFDDHPVWGDMVRVNMAVDGTINAVKNGMGTFTNDGTNGRVMVRIPKFWVKSASPAANVYQWWISAFPTAGFILHPAFKQSDGGAGAERDFVYVAAYEADPYYDSTNLVLHSRTGKQPFTGYDGGAPGSTGIWEVDFDAGTNEPAIGDDVSTPNDANFFIVDYVLTGGAWDGSGAGKLWIRKPGDAVCGWLDNDVITNNTQANQLATCEFTGGALTRLGFDLTEARAYAQNIGSGWNIWNVWEMTAIRLLYYIEYMGANSQDTTTGIGKGIVDKAGGTSFAGELTGHDNIDTNVGANGTGTGDGVDGLTPIAYRGIENLWANIWKWVEGWNAVNGVDAANDVKYRVLKKDGTTAFADALATYDESPNYVHAGLPDGYQKNIEWDDGFELLFLPSDVTGASTTYLYDHFYEHNNGETNVLFFGGAWDYGVQAGIGCLYSAHVATRSNRNLGGRLSFIG